MNNQYEIAFSVRYAENRTDVQVVILPASSPEEAHEKLKKEVKRRLGCCDMTVHFTHAYLSGEKKYEIVI
ncbi:hypothetical protein EXW59_04735 (plasmid) [Bacillus mycoides]|uniref:hypothetical protein n=1 Tax=Bacillus mycoides TaxID=1405 RepID=UPI001C00D65E|nr:hypothetical protein [Bacillus mycoides]QWH75352.1 hypothetical protein EXW59_00095 [Bacillus mycoides]QWH76104.1 hypothetical protein EXW59_04735 [Bacillus mycoides]